MAVSTPAPHTPIVLVKAGGSAFFSAQCIKLLTKQGYEMGEFGTYKSVGDYLKQCREKRKTFDAAIAKNPDAALANKAVADKHGSGLSQREYQLGEPSNKGRNPNAFVSGHTMMNATQVQSGARSVRGFGATPGGPGGAGDSPCLNTVDGHSTSNFPCVAERGGAVNNRGTDSNRNAALEYNQADANGATPGGAYANRPGADGQAQAERDADRRITHDQQRRRGEKDQPLSDRVSSGGKEQAAAAQLPGTHKSPDDAAKNLSGNRAKGDQVVTGNSAAECIRNFREMAAAGMRQEFAEKVSENEDAANKGGIKAPVSPEQRRAADQKRARAFADRKAARELRDQEEARIRASYSKGSRDISGDMQTDPRYQAADAMVREQEARYNGAVATCRAMDARCAAEQGKRIRDGQGAASPRCPGGGTDLPGAGRSAVDKPVSIF
jgi:hypothetical protein